MGPAVILWTALATGSRAQTVPATEIGPGAIAWIHLTPDCRPSLPDVMAGDGDTPQILSCGASGFFVFGKPGLRYQGACRSFEGATETPAAIPDERMPPYPPAFPCSQGSCASRAGGRPWIAVVDWPTGHGWSVEATIREASDQQVETQLFDLTANGALTRWVPSISDLHVLVQLCALADAVQARPDDRPLAVNLSFGRRATDGDCAQLGPNLGCAVGGVLADLAGAGVLPVAAAGNDREMLFPASSPGVVAAGALDLSRFERTQDVRPSSQTPDGAAALMLGYGLYLSADGKPPYWAAPPGSSYAAALLSGWLGGTLAAGGQLPAPLPKGAQWAPALAAATSGDLALTLDGVPLPGSTLTGPRLLFERAVNGTGPAQDPKSSLTLAFQGTAPSPPEHSVLHADSGYSPQPGVDPCVPCSGGPPERDVEDGGEDLTLDLSSSGALPPQMELVCLFLRIGKAVYAFEGSCDPTVIAPFAAGNLTSLTFSAIDGGLLATGEQPSLFLVVNVGGPSYWHEVPIQLPAH
jgi:hypothetical protein